MKVIEVLRRKQWAIIFVIYTRYLIGGAFVFSSIVKIQGGRFTTDDGSSYPIDSGWHLFETLYRSGLYWNFLGWSQLLAGMLLMTQRFATLGALLFFPITLNILFITLSYYFAGTPIITALLVIANIFLLVWDYHKLLPIFKKHNIPATNMLDPTNHNNLWTYTGMLLFLITVVYVMIFGSHPNVWILICVVLGLSAFILNIVRDKKS